MTIALIFLQAIGVVMLGGIVIWAFCEVVDWLF